MARKKEQTLPPTEDLWILSKTGEEIYEEIDKCFDRHCRSGLIMHEDEIPEYEVEVKRLDSQEWVKMKDVQVYIQKLLTTLGMGDHFKIGKKCECQYKDCFYYQFGIAKKNHCSECMTEYWKRKR